MSVSTTIINVGEYYSAHYLDSTLAKDVKEMLGAWRDAGASAPPAAVRGLSKLYFAAKTEVIEARDAEERQGRLGDRTSDMSLYREALLDALGYRDRVLQWYPVNGGTEVVPVLARYDRGGKPWLVIAQAGWCLSEADNGEASDPLEVEPRPLPELGAIPDGSTVVTPWERAIADLFTEEEAPRWCLLLSGSIITLFDRRTFAQGRYLRFDLDDAFGRGERESFEYLALFLSRTTLAPDADGGAVLHDTIEERSHKFAYGVSESLQGAVREAIEIVANEWIEDRRRRKLSFTERRPSEQMVGGSVEVTAEDLRHEALVYVYRLLFCFYAEARGGELGMLPMGDDIYRLGYSLEALRDLEFVPLTAETAEGTYFQRHLDRLFSLVHQGQPPILQHVLSDRGRVTPFVMNPLTAVLFDPQATPLLSGARLQNQALQRVVRLLSLASDERSRSVGRVNYAELGINQLGAVYEGLLSYRGMFADRDLIQVKAKGSDSRDASTPTWFVPKERLSEFAEDEYVSIDGGREPRIYPKGTFILHLNGIDRQKSASYYTPEVLTRCLVEETLRERLKDITSERADELLSLKVCEPAMGSGAFLHEVALQLADRYLVLKQKAVGRVIDPAQYQDELRRVVHYIAVNNLYGVDLNPTAVELGALSLWLGSIHRLPMNGDEGLGGSSSRPHYRVGATPWFGLRLRAGNSLVGARRAVWTVAEIMAGKHRETPPRELRPGEDRGADEVYHFLVLSEEMVSSAKDSFLKKEYPAECQRVQKWVKDEVVRRYDSDDCGKMLAISTAVDEHLKRYTVRRERALRDTSCTASVWPMDGWSDEAIRPSPSLQRQEEIRSELEATSGSYQRLRLVMDQWCSFWFWPVSRASELPSRDAWLAFAELVLGEVAPRREVVASLSIRLGFEVGPLVAAARGEVPDSETVRRVVRWGETAHGISERERFFHWEMTFPEVLVSGGGFDVVVGNPPWIKVTFDEKTVLAELEPRLGVDDSKKGGVLKVKKELLADEAKRLVFADELGKASSMGAFLNSGELYTQ